MAYQFFIHRVKGPSLRDGFSEAQLSWLFGFVFEGKRRQAFLGIAFWVRFWVRFFFFTLQLVLYLGIIGFWMFWEFLTWKQCGEFRDLKGGCLVIFGWVKGRLRIMLYFLGFLISVFHIQYILIHLIACFMRKNLYILHTMLHSAIAWNT